MNKKDLLKGILISIITLTVGFIAVAVPFNLFKSLSTDGARIFFIIEMTVYFLIGVTFLIIQDRKEAKQKKEKIRHERREAQIKEVKENWYNIAA